MPACNFPSIGPHNTHLLWYIDEPETALLRHQVWNTSKQAAYQAITSTRRKKEFLATRLALHQLLTIWGYPTDTLCKDHWGRPYLINNRLHVSIAHSYPFAWTAIAPQPIGIDIQQPGLKIYHVRAKFLNEEEVEDSQYQLEKLCIYWCAKEAIYKTHGGQGVSFKRDIRIHPFKKMLHGIVWGNIGAQLFKVHYHFYQGHVLTWSSKAAHNLSQSS